jgi:hypothetical protein
MQPLFTLSSLQQQSLSSPLSDDSSSRHLLLPPNNNVFGANDFFGDRTVDDLESSLESGRIGWDK